MELNNMEQGLLEELLQRECMNHHTNVWEQPNVPTPATTDDYNYNNVSPFDEWLNPSAAFPIYPNNSLEVAFPAPLVQLEQQGLYDPQLCGSFNAGFSAMDIADSSLDMAPPAAPLPLPFTAREDCPVFMTEEEVEEDVCPFVSCDHQMGMEFEASTACKMELSQSAGWITGGLEGGFCQVDRKNMARGKRAEGQPSKNLMAERRRRKRLNDRLSMLRSIVPKISKMDRTSIVGDTIEYMKELLEKIKKLEEAGDNSKELSLVGMINKDHTPNDINLVRNSPKFDVKKREGDDRDTLIEVCCPANPGLLPSTLTTMEALGLEIEQCVISCFNNFAMRASCSDLESDFQQRSAMSCEDIKQALFRNAGYGGRCL